MTKLALLAITVGCLTMISHDSVAQRRGGGGATRGRGGARSSGGGSIGARAGGGGGGGRLAGGGEAAARTSINGSATRSGADVRSRDANRDRKVNRDINRDVDVNRNWDVDVDVDDHWHPFATTAAVTAGAALTAAAIGSVVYSVPASCTVTVVNGISFQHCGSVWYEPQFVGTQVSYVVVSPP